VQFTLQNTDFALLGKALSNLGYASPETSSQGDLTFYRGREVVKVKGGDLTLLTLDPRRQNEEVNAIKRAYSTQVVLSQAKKFGWKLKERSPGKFMVQKAR
jgi:hypothetical protein